MDAIQKTLEKAAEYIGMTQPLLDQHNVNRIQFIKKARQTAGVLANKGLIAPDKVDAFVEKVAADESGREVWGLVEKLANAVQSDSFGRGAMEKFSAMGKQLDPFEKLVLLGDARADTSTSGMVD